MHSRQRASSGAPTTSTPISVNFLPVRTDIVRASSESLRAYTCASIRASVSTSPAVAARCATPARCRHHAPPVPTPCAQRSRACRVGDETFLNGGSKPVGKRERPNGKHRVTKLQHPRQKCGAAWRFDVIRDGHALEAGRCRRCMCMRFRVRVDTPGRTSVYASCLGSR